jgi:hypothetical protein
MFGKDHKLQSMQVVCPNVPAEVLPDLATKLRAFGASVDFHEDGLGGWIESVSGRMWFRHTEPDLTVVILEEYGHFPKRLLIGGIKQLVQETVESHRSLAAQLRGAAKTTTAQIEPQTA